MLRLPRDTVLMVIDLQQAIDQPKWGPRNNPTAEAKAADLIGEWRRRGMRLIHVRHDSVELNSPYRPGQPGHDFKPEVMPLPGETIVGKRTPSAFVGTDLEAMLEAGGHTTLVIAGVLTQNSIDATVRHAGNLGFRVILVDDATCAVDILDRKGRLWLADDVHELFLAALDGEYCTVCSCETVVAAMSRMRR
ncbi:MAG: cysteine hydrolase family protein [Ancalomicrobiaceae bacterium]|nr:cysteine hydrolase family protein [Ancalomicrobiaceae bacterium]